MQGITYVGEKMAPKFLSRAGLIGLGTVAAVIFIFMMAYYATLRPEATLTIGFTTLDVEQSKKLSILLQFVFGGIALAAVVGILVNEFSAWRAEKILTPPPPPPPPPPTSDIKFYPGDFLPDFKYFVGRGELLKKLAATLKKHHRASIHDISGLGKTFSAQRYADLNREKYQKIFFINAAKESYLESVADIAVMLMPALAKNNNQHERAFGLKAWLEKNEGWLAIYDNVDEPAVLKPFVPNSVEGDCIFTSNFRAVENIAPHKIEIDELEPEFARILLYSRARNKPESEPEFPDDAERQAFENLITVIDGLPIALLTTGAIIQRDQLGFTEFWEMFQKADEVVLEAEDEFGDYKKKSALKAFSIALDDISKDRKNDTKAIKAEKAAVREILNAACFLFPDDIPEEFLQAFLESNLTSFDRSDKKRWIALRNRFNNFDLFKFNSTARSFSSHRLIQKCIFSRLSEADKKTYAEKVLNLLLKFFPQYDYNNKEQCEMCYQHTLAALENADRTGFEARVSISLYYRVGEYQRLLGNYGQAEKFHGKQLEISKRVNSYEAPRTATALSCLAIVYHAQGKYDEAVELYKQAIEIGEKTIGKVHPDYAARLNNLAMVYDSQGKYDEAIELYKQAMEITEKALGKEHPDYAVRLNNLAAVYDAQGKYDEAVELYQQAIEIGKKTIGKDHPNYALSLNNLAWVYRSQEKYFKALPLFEEALRICEAKLPPKHEYIASVKECIAFCRSKIGAD